MTDARVRAHHTNIGAKAGTALVALLRVLRPEGQPRDLRDGGITTWPLAHVNAVLAPLGYVIVATKTRSLDRVVMCRDRMPRADPTDVCP